MRSSRLLSPGLVGSLTIQQCLPHPPARRLIHRVDGRLRSTQNPLIMAKRSSRGKMAILVGGGPAPGINGVISAATIEGVNQGFGVLGVRDGYKWLAKGDTEHCVR